MATIPVCLEVGAKRVFASALDWPGWCRSGKDPEQALAALDEYRSRYAEVARLAGHAVPADARLEVVERLKGGASTDFGAPGAAAAAEAQSLTKAQAERLAYLVEAAWQAFEATVARAPAELRKGPRGGGRDR